MTQRFEVAYPVFVNEVSAANARNHFLSEGWECGKIIKNKMRDDALTWSFDAKRPMKLSKKRKTV